MQYRQDRIEMAIITLLLGVAGFGGGYFLARCGLKVSQKPLRVRTEETIIRRAAERNNCRGDDYLILLAVHKAENGGNGKEFGIKNPKAWGTDLDTQAGWAAATIVKNRARWKSTQSRDDFISFLADRYCPPAVDSEGNENWKKNVRYWYRRYKRESQYRERKK